MLTATIITLPKPGKDPSLPQNFRPISLLNVDVKIYAKLIANRLSILLPKLINQDQEGFVSGRQANDATRRMINIIHSAEKLKMPSLLLTLDAEKAFDRVHWGYLVRVLEKFNIMGPIQKAIRASYSSPSAYVYTEGMFSKNFQITNGTRQGCPLSPLIFALVMEPLAEKIRTHPEIQGISSRHQQHRISLFADDVILTLSNPYQSLRAAQDTLDKFSEISYYKVNASKSIILGIGIDNPTKTAIQQDIPYPWATESISYLGVQLTSTITKLYEANYFPLISKMQQELSKIQKHYLTWGGRLAAYKMLILPKLIYFFRALPIPIPTSFFTAMQKQLLNFVWAGKRARFPVSLQRLHKSVGGLGTPSLKDYYMEAILDQLKGWFEQPTTKPWCQLEQSWLFPHTPRSLLIAQNVAKSKIVIDHPTIQASLDAWAYLKETPQANLNSSKVHIPLSSLHWLIPNISLGHWPQGDTLQLIDITKDDKILKFSDIQNKVRIPASEFLTYSQIASIFGQLNRNNHPIPTKTWKYLTSNNPKAKGISLFYDTLNSKSVFVKHNSQHKWEKEMGKVFTEKQWLDAIKCNHQFSRCANYDERAQKILARWYYTPYIVATFSDTGSSLCWRGCGQVGTLAHMVWACPNLRGFWSAVFKLIARITGVITRPTIEKAILSINMSEYPI